MINLFFSSIWSTLFFPPWFFFIMSLWQADEWRSIQALVLFVVITYTSMYNTYRIYKDRKRMYCAYIYHHFSCVLLSETTLFQMDCQALVVLLIFPSFSCSCSSLCVRVCVCAVLSIVTIIAYLLIARHCI